MRGHLFGKYGAAKGVSLRFDEHASLGRAGDNTLPVEGAQVSRYHARVVYDAASASFVLEDLDSRNGTWVDGERVHGTTTLPSFCVIDLGGWGDLFFEAPEAEHAAVPNAEDGVEE